MQYEVIYIMLEIFLLEYVWTNSDFPKEEGSMFLEKLLFFYQTIQCHIMEVMNFNHIHKIFKFRSPRYYLPAPLLCLSPSLSPEGPGGQHRTPLTAIAKGYCYCQFTDTHIHINY
jgi:hypothetical protein